MSIEQKTICIIRHDKTTLPILDYLDGPGLVSLGMNGGVILWVYKGLAMLIPPERVMNMVRIMEAGNKWRSDKILQQKFIFNSADAIKLPSRVAAALLGSDDKHDQRDDQR